MSERPWMKWYPGDWRADAKLAACEPMTRYVWMEMLGLMHEAEPYGHLTFNGKAMPPEVLARLIRVPLKAVNAALRELEENAVFNLTDAGVIYSRRQVRDELARTSSKVHGAKGGNPALKKQRLSTSVVKGHDKGEDIAHMPETRIQKEDKGSLRSPCPVEGGKLFGETDAQIIDPTAKPPPSDHPRFGEFWATYPKRLGTNSRKEASACFSRAIKSGVDPGVLIAGAARYSAHCDAVGKTGTDKVQQTTTWLNQQNWETDYGNPQHQHPAAAGRPSAPGNAHVANAVRSLEERRRLFTDPETGAFDRDAADAFDRDRLDRARAELFPATFGHRPR